MKPCPIPNCGGRLLIEGDRIRCTLCSQISWIPDPVQEAYKRDLANAERGHLKPGRKLKERP